MILNKNQAQIIPALQKTGINADSGMEMTGDEL